MSGSFAASLKQLGHELGSPRWFYQITHNWVRGFGAMAAVMLVVGCVWGLAFMPPDYQQGNSFRIMYVHVPAAMVAQSLYLGMGSGVYWFSVAHEACRCGDCCNPPAWYHPHCAGSFSGSVWGRPTWGSWWEWDGRTVSTLVMLFLYLGIYVLREAIAEADLRARAAALVSLVGTVNIPVIKYSVEWWNTLHQPASFTLTEKAGDACGNVAALAAGYGFGVLLFCGAIMYCRGCV